jgi:hypothetical protein
MFWPPIKLAAFLPALAWPAAAAAQCSPNPNLTPGYPANFVDGCPLPAAGLNSAFKGVIGNACQNILGYGGNNTGAAANDTAFAAAVTGGVAGKTCVYFPTGTYQFASQITATLSAAGQSFAIYGDSPDNSILLWPSAQGIAITETGGYGSVHVRDLQLVPGTSSGTAISVTSVPHTNNQAMSSFVHLKIGDPINGHFWSTGLLVSGPSTVRFSGNDIWNGSGSVDPASTGTRGIDLENTSSNLGFIFYIDTSNFYGAQYGLYYGPGVQGVTVNAVNFTLNHYGIYVSSSSTSAAQAQLAVVNSQFDNFNDNILVDTGSQLSHLQVTNNLAYITSGTNFVHVKSGGDFQVNHNNITAVAPFTLETTTSALLASNAEGVNLADENACFDITPCVSLTSTATGWNIRNTRIDGTATEVPVANANPGYNLLTGNQVTGIFAPQSNIVTAAANNGSGATRLTLGNAMTTANAFINDAVLLCNAPGLTNMPGLYKITVIDGTHIDLQGSAFGGSLSGAGVCFEQ